MATNYLHRPLLPDLLGALAPRGVLLYETFAVGNARHGRPSCPAFLLRSPHMKKACWEDIQLAMAELGLALPG